MRLGLAFALLPLSFLFAQTGPDAGVDDAARMFEQGDSAGAQQKLLAVLNGNPRDLRALILTGVVLDSQKRYSDAEPYYRRALAIAPDSGPVLNNVANHYLSAGDRRQAIVFYRKAVAADPRHPNANVQLARFAIEEKHGAEALGYLNRLGGEVAVEPAILEMRARALALTGQCSQAGDLAAKLQQLPDAGGRIFFSAGAIHAECKQYDRAEAAFSRALDADPGNFDILYNLGLAALHAGHTERAARVFEIASGKHPEDPDCLFGLAQAYAAQQRTVEAAALLGKAARLAPQRPDILLLFADISMRLEFYEDSAKTYDRYLALRPTDERARRERAFVLAKAGQTRTAMPDLEAYARKHPRDPVAWYELAVSQAPADRLKAMSSLDRALALDENFPQPRYTRAILNLEAGKAPAAIPDLEWLRDRGHGNDHVLARLGEAYLALNRPRDAAQVLEEGLKGAPNSLSLLAQYSRALDKLGRKPEAAAISARLKQSAAQPRPRAGLLAYLSLPPAEQRERYLANLRKTIAANPEDLHLQIRLGEELLADGNREDALQVFREIAKASSDPVILARSGSVLLHFEQYDAALPLLEAAAAAPSPPPGVRLDFATALYRMQGAAPALAALDKTGETERNGDYHLLRAQLLDALGKVPEAAEALDRGMRAAPTRPDLYFQAASFLLKHQMRREALSLLEQASQIVPDARELLLAQWVTLFLLHRETDAAKLLAKIQARWPEWDRPYLLNGILLQIQLRSADALHSLDTAISLGADTPEVHYYRALALMQTAPEDLESAKASISRALALTQKDPHLYLLAGKISAAQKDYPAAVSNLSEAVRLQPSLIPAHYALRSAYKAMGDDGKSAAELEAIKRIGQENAASDTSPFSVEDFLFGVRPPG
ncbi:MAG: tetratricopeptide repeat protein [Bryobacteraceae bacterium]